MRSQLITLAHRRKKRGTTLIDMMIGMTLLAIVLGSIATAGNSGTSLFQSGVVRSQLEVQATRTMNKLRQQLLVSEIESIAGIAQAPFWDNQVVFDQPEGFSSDVGMLGTRSTRIEFRYEDGELDDGIDNDSDGKIDEGVVVMTRDFGGPEEQEVVLCRDVREYLEGELPNGLDDNGNGLIDERGLCFDHSGENLFVRLSLEGRDRLGNVITRTLVTSVWLRN